MLRSFLLASAALFVLPAHAADKPATPGDTDSSSSTAPAPAPAAEGGQDHADQSPEIVVTGTRARNTADVLGGTSVLAAGELTRDIRPSIGETLASQPGVSATSFGPNSSRPVLRGFIGARAPLLTDGIGSIDVSNTSADHAPIINPLTADRIEVLRGPTALIFGPSAIGGVVNVIDSRIPRHMPQEAIHADGIATYGSASDERSVSGAVDLPVAGKLVVHADGSFSQTGDQHIGGYVLGPALRAQALASSDADVRDLADLKGTLPNSAAKTWNVAGAAAIIDDNGNLGFSAAHYDTLYGVPIRYSLDPSIEAEQVRLHAQQDRFDLRGEVNTGTGFLKQIRLRAAAADYKHSEIDDTGAIGTTFFSQGYEARLEMVQKTIGGWDGEFGGAFSIRDMHVVGDEKFLPKNEAQQFSLFTLQSLDIGLIKAEAALRYEHNELSAEADADIGNAAYDRSFDNVSGSLGASYPIFKGVRFGVNVSHSERAPTAEELFADGPHAGTQAFEIGNPDFGTEKSWGVEATLKGTGDGYSFSTAAYYNWFTGYIYDAPTGAVRDDLPVFQSYQADARYYGFEAEGSVRVKQAGQFGINLDGLADYVHAEVVDNGPVPRIPPLRLKGGIEASSSLLDGRIEVEHDFEQTRTGPFETTTPAFTLVNASVSWKPWGENATSLTLSADNLFDVDARRAASVLKDYAPLAGRDIRITARIQI